MTGQDSDLINYTLLWGIEAQRVLRGMEDSQEDTRTEAAARADQKRGSLSLGETDF